MLQRKTNRAVEKRFNTMLMYSILINVLYFGVGIVMMLVPSLSDKVIGIIVGLLFIINGGVIVYKYLKRDGAKLYSLNLVFGIMSAILGLVLILYPYSLIDFVIICLGIYLIIIGALNINYGVWFKIGKEESWAITVVIGILLVVFGILVIVNPFSSLALTQVVGVFLMILAVLQITDSILLKKRADDIMKIFW